MFKNKSINTILLTIIITVIVFAIFDNFVRPLLSDDRVVINSENIQNPSEESIDTNYVQINTLLEEYKANKVAFDKRNKDKVVEFQGRITEITNKSGCAGIEFKVYNNSGNFIGYANCSNCPADRDGWSDEVSLVQVDDTIKIRGYYSDFLSDSDTMSFYKCHILK